MLVADLINNAIYIQSIIDTSFKASPDTCSYPCVVKYPIAK